MTPHISPSCVSYGVSIVRIHLDTALELSSQDCMHIKKDMPSVPIILGEKVNADGYFFNVNTYLQLGVKFVELINSLWPSETKVIISSGNGLLFSTKPLPERRRHNVCWTLRNESYEILIKKIIQQNEFWKCHLQNDAHFVQAVLCWG